MLKFLEMQPGKEKIVFGLIWNFTKVVRHLRTSDLPTRDSTFAECSHLQGILHQSTRTWPFIKSPLSIAASSMRRLQYRAGSATRPAPPWPLLCLSLPCFLPQEAELSGLPQASSHQPMRGSGRKSKGKRRERLGYSLPAPLLPNSKVWMQLPPLFQLQTSQSSCRPQHGKNFQLSLVSGSLTIFSWLPKPCPHIPSSLVN